MPLKELSQSLSQVPISDGETERMLSEWLTPWCVVKKRKTALEKKGMPLVIELGRAPLPTDFGDWTYIVFGDLSTGHYHEVLVYGNFRSGDSFAEKKPLVRIHSACQTNETFGAVNCECRAELIRTMKAMQERQEGIIIYLAQEGRGTGVVGKLAQLDQMFSWQEGKIIQNRLPDGRRLDTDTAYKNAGWPSESRDFTVAGKILEALSVRECFLVTNNPNKIEGLKNASIAVEIVEIHIPPVNGIVAADLRSKAENLGHRIKPEDYYHDDI